MTNIAQPPEEIKKNFWLVKFAPFRTSWTEIVQHGTFTLRGIRSAGARKHLAAMRLCDSVFFYHSQQELSIVGIMAVSREAYPDPTSADPKWLTCDFTPLQTLCHPVPLSELRKKHVFSDLPLLRQPRLAVMPLTLEEFQQIHNLSQE